MPTIISKLLIHAILQAVNSEDSKIKLNFMLRNAQIS